MTNRLAPLFLVLALLLPGCALFQDNPVEQAKTLEQKAFASYGLFVIAEEEAANLMADPAIPDSVKFQIQFADRIAKPAADILLRAAKGVEQARKELEAVANPTAEDKLLVALQALNAAYADAKPRIQALQSAVKNR